MVKLQGLKEQLKQLKRLAIAYSGGVDSTFLMAVANEVLGPENVRDYFIVSPMNPQRDVYEAHAIAEMNHWNVKTIKSDPWEEEKIYRNEADRCYFCKHSIFEDILEEAKKEGFAYLADGSNIDDEGDYRPGMKALEELKVLSPLREMGLSKEEIRKYSKECYDLPTWNKPSATCLASRIPYGTPLTKENLSLVDQGESLLQGLGYKNCRLRYHGNLCRIELLPEDFERFMANDREQVFEELRKLGFIYVTLDLFGYKSGSTNLVLEAE